jgi:membrane protein
MQPLEREEEDVTKKTFLERFVIKFVEDDTTTLAASLAFYMALSLAPLLILFVSITSHLGPDLQQDLIGEVGEIAGFQASKAVATVIDGAGHEPQLTSLAGLMGLVTLLISASLIFGQLRDTLNRILDVRVVKKRAMSYLAILIAYLRTRLMNIAMALGFIFAMILALFFSTMFLSGLHAHTPLMMIANGILSALLYAVIFSLLFHFLPDQHLAWPYALKGGALTSILFVFGKELIAVYLARASLGSAYGAAGSIIVFLVWVYYSALITFVGAQVSSLLGNNAPHRSRGRS